MGAAFLRNTVFFIAMALSLVAPINVNHSHAVGDLGIVVEKVEGSGEVRQCKYCGRFMKVGNVPRGAEAILTNLLREGLTKRDVGYRSDKGDGNYISLLIYRYDQRVGGNLGADKPAGMGFHLHLMENNILQRVFVFDEDQQALSENLFNIGKFFRRGPRWLTVEELARDAINQGLDAIFEDRK